MRSPPKSRKYVSCKTADGTERLCCLKRSLRRQKSVSGSPWVVVSTFWARSWEEASQVHYDLNGWGKYDPTPLVEIPPPCLTDGGG